MKKVLALKTGDTIGIAAPSSPFDRKLFMKGVHALERMGFKVYHRPDIFDQNRYLAGTDARRAEEFTELFTNKNISAIMFARGGYGSQRIIPLLNAETIRNHAKPVVGFSDVTALLSFLRQEAGVPTFYGPVMTQLGRTPSDGVTHESLFKALSARGPLGTVPMMGSKTLQTGSAEGTIVGGCLTIINSSMGTPYELDTRESILLIEDVGEKVYALDRMLTQLKNSGKLADARAIVFGSLIPPENEPYDVQSMIRDVLTGFGGPVVVDFPAGHRDEFVTLPLGANCRIEAPEGKPPSITFTSGHLS